VGGRTIEGSADFQADLTKPPSGLVSADFAGADEDALGS